MSESQKSAATTDGTLVTPEELATIVILMRSSRKWSQEQLADLAGVNVRTIQRLEQGGASSFDTRRAVARAFDAPDIDCFNKPFVRKSAEDLRAEKEKFDREHVTLPTRLLDTGRKVIDAMERSSLDTFHATFDMPADASLALAELADFAREYRDCQDLYEEVQKLEIAKEFQEKLDRLDRCGVTLRWVEREASVRFQQSNVKGVSMNALYVMAFQKGKSPSAIILAANEEVVV